MVRWSKAAWIMILGACSPSTPPETAKPPKQVDARPQAAKAEPEAEPPSECDRLWQTYTDARAELNRCERDNDCAEMYPGPCPGGSYYVHREADPAPLQPLLAAYWDACGRPRCAKQKEQGAARCVDGHCEAGRPPAPESADESCWDYREAYLESSQRAAGQTTAHQQGITPRFSAGVGGPGTMTVAVDWSGCTDCRLAISEHNSGMASPPKAKRTKKGSAETFTFPVTEGPYYFMAHSPTSPHAYTLEIRLEDASGAETTTTRHGVAWQRMCEG